LARSFTYDKEIIIFKPYHSNSNAVLFVVPVSLLQPCDFMYLEGIKCIPDIFANIDENTPLVRIWAFGPKDGKDWSNTQSNWADYGVPDYCNITFNNSLEYCFPKYIPINVLQNKKEGDQITLIVNNTPVVFELNQLHTRKGYNGAIENVINKLTKQYKEQYA